MLETDTENIGGMGKNLRELGGMLLISDAGGFWGTEWDDQSSGRIISGSGRKKKQMLIRKRKRRKEKDNGEKLQKQKKIKKLVFLQKCRKNRMQQTRS